ncbi:putative LPS assembly protein LptD [Ekhidna sp. To15]|uniref:putative LPS assembly protein LptD n=1 Tax=Ekhidna sp. To15 TaxID=3395267 RepID=UPI003F51CB81
MRCLIVLFCLIFSFWAQSQEADSVYTQAEEDISIGDSLATVLPSDTTKTDTTNTQQKPTNQSDIQTTINYNAKDSLFFNVKSRELFLYGDTHIDYGRVALDAERTDVDWTKRTLKAKYVTDSTGRKIGKPVFTEGPDTYVTDDIVYNFKTERALIKGVITEKQGGFMHGEDVKKNADDELFIRGAAYTTCNLEDPHFSIQSSKLKVIPNNKVVSGPFNMRFRDVPTPIFFPFGMFPQPNEKSSGIIVPSYGEEQRRGFFLRNGGYYFAISDYVDLRLTGDIYSKGGSGVNAVSNYFKRYSFRGTFNFSYANSVTDDIENPIETNDYSVRWNHTPESKGNSSFSASVNAATRTYTQNNNLVVQDFDRSINSQLASSISYRKTFAGTPFNMSSNLRHSQNLQSGIVNLTLPDLTVNMNRIYPFKNVVKTSKSPLSKLNFSHNLVAKNELSNDRVRNFNFNVVNRSSRSDSVITFNSSNFDEIFRRSQFGFKHAVPISTSMSVLKYFTLNPTFNYQELWYTKELQYEYIPEENGVQVDTVSGFSRAGSWSTGASLNTRMYGTVFFNKGKIQAIRHVMTPSVSFSYSPDFSDTKYGVYSEIQIDSLGNTQRVSKYEGFAYGSPPGGESKTIGFSLSNNIEMKVASKKDTVNGFTKVKLFDNLGISSGYNLAADSFKLSNINLNARTSFFDGKISLNVTGTLDPYEYLLLSESTNSRGERVVSQRRLDRFTWSNGNGLGRLSSLNTAIGINLSPSGSSNRNNTNSPGNNNDFGNTGLEAPDEQVGFDGYSDLERDQINHIQNNPELYVDFKVPWSLRMQYSINRTKRGFEEAAIRQSFQFSGTLGLTDKTQITFNSGYDFEAKDFTTTRVGVARDLHCWTMNFDWVPFGRFQSYFLSIRVKSSILQDLKLEKRRSFFDFFN